MPNTITINFIPCEPTPNQGYRLTWRVAGTADPYTDEGLFTESPASFVDSINPAGTCYEGFLQSDCSESGESGTVLGEAIPWATPCEDSGVTYTITLANPCVGINSSYLIENGVNGDTVKVRAQFIGLIQKISNTKTQAELTISSPEGTSDSELSACYSDTASHPFSITADTIITMVGDSATVNLAAVTHNSSSSMSSVSVSIIEINGQPVNISVSGCAGNDSPTGDC